MRKVHERSGNVDVVVELMAQLIAIPQKTSETSVFGNSAASTY